MNKLIRAQNSYSYEKHRTVIEVCCKHKSYYYVQPEYIYFFFHGPFYFSVVAGGTLHFYSFFFSVNDFAGVEILVLLLWP